MHPRDPRSPNYEWNVEAVGPIFHSSCRAAHFAYLSSVQAETSKIKFNPTQVRDVMGHPVCEKASDELVL